MTVRCGVIGHTSSRETALWPTRRSCCRLPAVLARLCSCSVEGFCLINTPGDGKGTAAGVGSPGGSHWESERAAAASQSVWRRLHFERARAKVSPGGRWCLHDPGFLISASARREKNSPGVWVRDSRRTDHLSPDRVWQTAPFCSQL